jgi:hypothetical protein
MKKFNNIHFAILIFIFAVLTFNNGYGQASTTSRQLTITKIKAEIKIDGQLDDAAWTTAAHANNFINKWPVDSGAALLQTEISVTYNDQFLYVGIKAYHTDKDLVIQSLKRDINPYYSDGVSIVLDPSNRNVSGYTFGVNGAGAQADGIVEVNSASFEWDGKWYSSVRRSKNYWTAEIAIPFNSLRFPAGQTQWGINFIRNDMTNNCFSTWNQVPIQFFGANLNYLGRLIFSDASPESSHNYAVFPYVSVKLDQEKHSNNGQDLDEGKNESSSSMSAGIDAKIALSASLNLDATINPDFSQVDVDRQIINLNRFSVLLPERRTFFLENSDLFSNRGVIEATPFVSRKIGLTDDGRIVPILAGARVTGNVNPNLRIGVMNIQSRKKYGLPSQNYSVASFDQKILRRSNIRGMFTNRDASLDSAGRSSFQKYNRVAGLEFNFLSTNSKFNGRSGYYYSFNPGNSTAGGYALATVGYTNKSLNITAGWMQLNSNFISDLGFTPRLYNYDAQRDTVIRIGYDLYNAGIDYSFYPRSKKTINSVVYSVKTNNYYVNHNRLLEFNGEAGFTILFANRREAAITWTQNNVDLLFGTTIFTETGILEKGKYHFGFIRLKYFSNFLRPFSWGLTLEEGEYYNGRRRTLMGNVKYRQQPWGVFSVDFIYNKITLNEKDVYPIIISPSIELCFTRNIFWTTFLQYNTLLENFNINSRFQWRFRPMSDIFLVYSDNYLTDGFINRNKALVFKISCRIN